MSQYPLRACAAQWELITQMHVHVFCYVSLQWSTFDQITSLCYLAVLFSPPIDFLITLHPILGIFSEGHILAKEFV